MEMQRSATSQELSQKRNFFFCRKAANVEGNVIVLVIRLSQLENVRWLNRESESNSHCIWCDL